jgi:HlyD family secretion protein
MKPLLRLLAPVVAASLAAGCQRDAKPSTPRATGYVEATEVRVASKVPGRIATVNAVEGARVEAGATLVTLATTEIDLALQRAHAERAQATAKLQLLQAGSRPEDILQAEAQVAAAVSDRRGAEADLAAAKADEVRFEQLLQNKAGSAKQRDDAVARRELTEARLKAAADRVNAAAAVRDRLKAGARPEELAAARGAIAAVDAEIARLEHDKSEATIISPMSGIVTSRLVEPGELAAVGTPLVLLVDLDHAWASVYVEEPLVPSLRIDEAATVVTDAGDRLPGRIVFIAPRAEFTPRNVQTTAERAKLVYRVKVAVTNTKGILKPGMPVEAEFEGVAPPAGK